MRSEVGISRFLVKAPSLAIETQVGMATPRVTVLHASRVGNLIGALRDGAPANWGSQRWAGGASAQAPPIALGIAWVIGTDYPIGGEDPLYVR